jgi:hypothetical protein
MDHKKSVGKNDEDFSWIQISSLKKTFLWNQAMRFHYELCQRYGDTGGIEQTGTHNRSQNDRDAWVA